MGFERVEMNVFNFAEIQSLPCPPTAEKPEDFRWNIGLNKNWGEPFFFRKLFYFTIFLGHPV